MKRAQIVKTLQNIPQGLYKLEHGMRFQVKKTNANKIDFDIIEIKINHMNSAKMRRSIKKGGDTFIPMRISNSNNSI